MLATAEVGTNLQTAIEAVGCAWAVAFAAFAFFKYGIKHYWEGNAILTEAEKFEPTPPPPPDSVESPSIRN